MAKAQVECFEDLFDFPVSWDWYRHYCLYENREDPGDNLSRVKCNEVTSQNAKRDFEPAAD